MKAKLKENWAPKWRKRKPDNWESPQPTVNPTWTNHRRVVAQRELQQRRRELAAQAKAKTKEEVPNHE